MRCEQLMKTTVQWLAEGQSVEEAARRMREFDIGFLPICNAVGEVSGTLTDRDITVRVTANGRAADRCLVEEVMTREVVAVRPEDEVARAEQLMAQYHKSRILVTDDAHKLKGVISLSDVATYDTAHRASTTLRHVASREAKGST